MNIAVLFGGLFELGHETFDVVGHVVEGVGELGNFGSTLHLRARLKVSAADGSSGSGQRAYRRADSDGEQVSKDERGERDDDDECESLRV